MPGFVAGSENIFQPLAIAVAPTTGEDESARIVAGGVYDPDGKLIEPVVVQDIKATVTSGLKRALRDAGLRPSKSGGAGNPSSRAGFVLNSRLVSAEVSKRFGAQQTVHGQYFEMDAAVSIAFEVRDRAGKIVFSKVIAGTENEPPKPVGQEVFFPLETDPVEALSVAMSRAIGALIVDPGFRTLMPARPKPAAP